MPRSASYDDLLMEMLKDEQRALAYLNAALDEPDPRVFLIALRNVTLAQGGIAAVAARAGLNRESLYKALSGKGNPSVHTLAAVLEALGARLGVARKRAAAPAPLSAEQLLEKVWDENTDPFTKTVPVTVGRLRRKLGTPDLIATVAGAGYRLCDEPEVCPRG